MHSTVPVSSVLSPKLSNWHNLPRMIFCLASSIRINSDKASTCSPTSLQRERAICVHCLRLCRASHRSVTMQRAFQWASWGIMASNGGDLAKEARSGILRSRLSRYILHSVCRITRQILPSFEAVVQRMRTELGLFGLTGWWRRIVFFCRCLTIKGNTLSSGWHLWRYFSYRLLKFSRTYLFIT